MFISWNEVLFGYKRAPNQLKFDFLPKAPSFLDSHQFKRGSYNSRPLRVRLRDNKIRRNFYFTLSGYDNLASIGVMKKLGMRIEKNPLAEPPWLQIVGVLDFTPFDPGTAQPIPE